MYCLLNVALLLVAILLVRRAYAVFGAFGISAYLSHLAEVVFKNSLLFPFALSLIGIGVIAAGLLYHRKQQAIRAWFNANLPEAVLRLRPAHAR
jgi:formate-dependent nitrite reductase membrane component NrfD